MDREQRSEDSPAFLPQYNQSYVDSEVVGGGGEEAHGGEDSSYDSDYEAEGEGVGGRHRDVSRTTSDTLAAEFAEYVSTEAGGGYTSRLEFGLKLGYTELHVQAALHKLGPCPSQNELLAELIKLGAHAQPLGNEGNFDWTEDAEDLAVIEAQADISKLRPIVIDGSNVAMSHGNKEVFSCHGIKICVDWFRARGHKEITVFVPKWRKEASRPDNPITDQDILYELERERLLVFTPSRLVGGKRLVCYDDRYILRLAAEIGGIVVSNDNYRDLAQESPKFRKVIEERILMYSFVNDRFMPPDDPLGRSGPTLDKFLQVNTHLGEPPPPCPYAKKCTYGNKCKFQHPERGTMPHKTVTERLVEHAQRQLQARARDSSPGKQVKGKSLSLPLEGCIEKQSGGLLRKAPLSRTKSSVVTSSEETGGLSGSSSYQENLHKKLQRQLSLAPGCDPRLYQGRRHTGVSRHVSCEPLSHQHNSVTRIASAPAPSSLHCLPHHSLSSASDPSLWPHPPTPSATEEARCRLHYHLASIFPEDQVRAAMHLYPTETNPKKICALILALSSKP